MSISLIPYSGENFREFREFLSIRKKFFREYFTISYNKGRLFSLVRKRLLLHIEDRMALFSLSLLNVTVHYQNQMAHSQRFYQVQALLLHKEVEHLLKAEAKEPGKRARYDFFTPEEKAQIGKRAAEHGVTATIRFWAIKFPGRSRAWRD